MLNNYEIKINLAAQGFIDDHQIVEWFRLLSQDAKKIALNNLLYSAMQSHPTKEEVELAISKSKLKPTFTPCVILRSAAIPEKSFHKIINLPEDEQEKSFRLLFSLFALADKRRRETHCINGCSHEWHNIKP